MDEEFIRNRITELRLKKGASEYQMSLALGQNRSYIQGISSGRSLPSMAQFLKICDYTQRSHRPESGSRGQRPKSSVRLARICFSGLLEFSSLPIHLRSPAGLCRQSDRKGCKLTEQPNIDGGCEGHFHLVAELDFSGVAP